VDAADALDQGRLAGAVVADERGDLAGRHREVDLTQYLHRAEALLTPRISSSGAVDMGLLGWGRVSGAAGPPRRTPGRIS